LGTLANYRLGTFAWKLSFRNLRVVALAWALSLGNFRLGTFAQELPPGNFRLRSWDSDVGLGFEAGVAGLLKLGDLEQSGWGNRLEGSRRNRPG